MLCISTAQLLVGLCLLGLYEGYKAYYFNKWVHDVCGAARDVPNITTTRLSKAGYQAFDHSVMLQQDGVCKHKKPPGGVQANT